MKKLRDPILFSMQFGVKPERLAQLGVLDPTLNADTRLFIDPLLLKRSKHEIIREGAVRNYEDHFGAVIRLLQVSRVPGDVPWRNAERLLTFPEVQGTCLGYGTESVRGSAFGPALRSHLIRTAKEIVDLGVADPELFSLLALLEDDVGADRISDMTTTVILPSLIQFNREIVSSLGVPVEPFQFGTIEAELPRNPFEKARVPIILVPTDILRELPIASGWDDVADAASKNEQLRNRVNAHIGDIWAIRTRKDKAKARDSALRSKEAFQTLLDTMRASDQGAYSQTEDFLGHYLWRKVRATIDESYSFTVVKPPLRGVDDVERVVASIIENFRDLVENNGLSYLLWHDGKLRHEKAAQRLFFAVADAYCKAANLDLSPEADSGGGPVDFKVSSGYEARVLVEVKLSSSSKLRHGYEKQLEVYKAAERATRAFYLIIDVGDLERKLEPIVELRNRRLAAGEPASKIEVVDGEIKPSASKR